LLKIGASGKADASFRNPLMGGAIITPVDETRLFLGVETNKTGERIIVIFIKTEESFVEFDRLYYDGWEIEHDENDRSFFWAAFDGFKHKSRKEVKARLAVFGFDPGIVDRIYCTKGTTC